MYRIGIDLGGTNTAGGIVDKSGKILNKKSIPTRREQEAEEIISDIHKLCKALIYDLEINEDELELIGIGSPGLTDPQNGRIIYANNLKFRDVDVREIMGRYTKTKVAVNNDANCAALGEAVAGAAKGYKNSVTITLGTGVGGVCSQGDGILIPLREKFNELVYGKRAVSKLAIAVLGNDAGIVGAANLTE